MIPRPVAAMLSIAIAMPALACDEEYKMLAPRAPMVAASARAHAVSPGALSPFAVSVLAQNETNSTVTIVDDQNGKRIEIRIRNEKVEATIDGEKVPEDRIRRDDDGITIVDEEGEPIYTSNLRFGLDEEALGAYALAQEWGEPLTGYTAWLLDKEMEAMEPPKVMLGVHMNETGPALEKQLKLDPGTTTLLTGVYEGLPANAAGIEEYDIILSVEGSEKADPASIRELLKNKEPGDALNVEVMRGGEKQKISIALEKYDRQKMNEAALRGAPPGTSLYFNRTPGTFEHFVLPPMPGEGGPRGGIVLDRHRLDRLREAPMAIADDLRLKALDKLRDFDIDEESLHQQIDEMRQRLDELTEMMHKMIEEAAEAKEKALKENET